MWEKIKAFFQKKAVIITEGICIALASAGLIIAGVNAEAVVPSITTIVVGICTGIEALITLIQGIFKK